MELDQRIIDTIEGTLKINATYEDIIHAVWNNPNLINTFGHIPIRLETARGLMANVILTKFNNNKSIINAGIGDIAYAGGNEEYDNFRNKIITDSSNIQRLISHKQYNLTAQGAEEIRTNTLNFFNNFYNFNDKTLSQLQKNSTICSGGMQGLKFCVSGFINKSLQENKKIRFIYPKNSFSSWSSFMNREILGREETVSNHTIDVYDENNLHIVSDQVKDFYRNQEVQNNTNDVWYITPVGNPSGTEMLTDSPHKVCSKILDKNPEATIIVDIVYARILGEERAQELLGELFQDENMMDRIIFIESASKSNAQTGNRTGFFASANNDIFNVVNKDNVLDTAGHQNLAPQIWNILSQNNPEDVKGFQKFYSQWASSLQTLEQKIKNLADQGIFKKEQPHIYNIDINQPRSIYMCPAIDPKFAEALISDGRLMVMQTGLNGVPIKLRESEFPTHLRLSVGAM